MEKRNRLQQPARDSLSAEVCIVAAGVDLGGAERSLLTLLSESNSKATFLLPGVGSLSQHVEMEGHRVEIFPMPNAFFAYARGSRRLNSLAAISLLWQLPGHLLKLQQRLKKATVIRSVGMRSHFRLLLLSPWIRKRLVFDVRDFIEGTMFRQLLNACSKQWGCRIQTNSHAIAKGLHQAKVVYPKVMLPRPVISRRNASPKIIAHAAYFAPYKGQDVFLELAAKLVSQGLDAYFWVLGEVIYPGKEYAQFAEKVHALSLREELRGRIRFFGNVKDVQEIFEQCHLLLHCTRKPEPYGRVIVEALKCGCDVICHRDSGACEVLETAPAFPEWIKPLRAMMGEEYVSVSDPKRKLFLSASDC